MRCVKLTAGESLQVTDTRIIHCTARTSITLSQNLAVLRGLVPILLVILGLLPVERGRDGGPAVLMLKSLPSKSPKNRKAI